MAPPDDRPHDGHFCHSCPPPAYLEALKGRVSALVGTTSPVVIAEGRVQLTAGISETGVINAGGTR